MADRWEYYTGTFHASIDNQGAAELIAIRWPNWNAPKYAPQTMIPTLNDFGRDGWELVSLYPVAGEGSNGDIYYNGEYHTYSKVYFGVFKRRLD